MKLSPNQNSNGPKLIRWFIAGAALGAASVYFLDPDQGRHRRTLVRDQTVRRLNESSDHFAKSFRNFRNQVFGFFAKLSNSLKDHEADNETLLNRIRSRFGHHVSHPRSIFVRVHDGEVTLTGHVLADELSELLRSVNDVPGVRHVLNKLEIHESAGSFPGLQGEAPPLH